MATVDVYNLDSVKARTIFSMAKPEDILQTQIICMARVKVPDAEYGSRNWAYFDEMYQGAGSISRPCMIVKGLVSEVFIEDSDDRTFPCGAKRLVLKAFDEDYPDKREEVPVRIVWKLTSDEISYLYSRGLGYSDFGPPSLLRGNELEIPINIVYKAIYETPISAISIVDPGRIETSTLYNRYDTIFMNCEVSADLLHEKANGVQITFNYDPTVSVDYYDENVEYQADSIDEAEINALNDLNEHEMTADEIRDANISSDIETKLQDTADRDMEAKDASDAKFSVADLLSSIKSDIAEQEVEDSDDYYAEPKEQKGTLKLSDRIDMLKSKTTSASDDASGSSENPYDRSDESQTNEFSDFALLDEGSLSDTDKEHKKSEKQARKMQEDIRRLDVALDNKALNDGRTDTAGFGASDDEIKKPGNKLTEELFSDLFDEPADDKDNKAPTDSSETTNSNSTSTSNNSPRFL